MRICLFEPDIPQNVGSLIRLCACLHSELHIIEPCGFPLDDKRLRRVAMDYADLAHLIRHSSWQQFLQLLQEERQAGLSARLILLSTQASIPYTELAFHANDILLLGRESAGVPDYVHQRADLRLRIPIQSGARSLNLVQAASIVLAESLRQTNSFPE